MEQPAAEQEAASNPVAALQAKEEAAAAAAAAAAGTAAAAADAAAQEAALAAGLAAGFWDPVWVLEARCLQALAQHGPQFYYALLPLLGKDSLPPSLLAGAAPGMSPTSAFELFLRKRPHLFRPQLDGSVRLEPGQHQRHQQPAPSALPSSSSAASGRKAGRPPAFLPSCLMPLMAHVLCMRPRRPPMCILWVHLPSCSSRGTFSTTCAVGYAAAQLPGGPLPFTHAAFSVVQHASDCCLPAGEP